MIRSIRVIPVALLFLAIQIACVRFVSADVKNLQGTWTVVRVESGGRPLADNGGYTSILIYDGKIVFNNVRFEAMTMSFHLDDSRTPQQMDVYDEQGQKLLRQGIYELRNDTLRICQGDPRPTKFDTAAGSSNRLFVCKRKAR